MLKLEQIVKSYGQEKVLKGVNLHIKKGEIYGLVGANGSGKTTLFNIISQILTYDSGNVIFEGKKITTINDLAQKTGYIIDIPAMDEYLTAFEYLQFLYSPSQKTKSEINKRAQEVLKLVGLEKAANKKIKTFSRGMKQRMGIAAGLVFEPSLIIMDEPSSALDPQGRIEVANIIKNLKKQGKTVILSTHILHDVEKLCDRIGLLINGVIEVEGSVNQVLNNYSENKIKLECDLGQIDVLKQKLADYNLEKACKIVDNAIEIAFKNKKQKQQILTAIALANINFKQITQKTLSLEEIFIKTSEKECK